VKDLESHGLKCNVKLKRCAFLIICSDSNRVNVNDWLSNYVFRELKRHIDSLLRLDSMSISVNVGTEFTIRNSKVA